MANYYTPGSGGGKYTPSEDFYNRNGSYGSDPNPDRPWQDLGKSTISLLGTPAVQQDPALTAFKQQAPHPLDALGIGKVPILGGLLKGATDIISKVPNVMPFMAGAQLAQRGLAAAAWEQGKGTPQGAALQQQIDSGWVGAGEAQAQYLRSWWKDNSPLPLLADYVVPHDTLGGQVFQSLGVLSLGQMALQRTLVPGGPRLRELVEASDEVLENNPDLIRIRDEYKAGTLTEDQTYDQLWEAGFLLSNPMGQDLFGRMASLGQEIVTDPVNLLSGGTALLARQTTRAAARLAANLAKEVGPDALEPLLTSYAARTGRSLDANLGQEFIDEVLSNPATTQQAQRAINGLSKQQRFWAGQTGGVMGQTIVKYGRYAERVLDPFTLFGGGDAARGSAQMVARAAAEGSMETYGVGTVRAAQTTIARVAGVQAREQFDHFYGSAMQQTVAMVGSEGHAQKMLATMAFDAADNPADLALQATRMYGSDIRRYVRDKGETVMYRVIPKAGETMEQAMDAARGRATQQLRTMLNISDTQARSIMQGQGEQFISLVDYAHFGHAVRSFLLAKRAAGATVDEVTFLGPRQLTRPELKRFRQAIKNREVTVVRQMVRQYDQLYFNIALDGTDDFLLEHADLLAKGLADKVPNEITGKALKALPKDIRAWVSANPGYRLAYKPKDQWGAVMGKDNQLVGINPWVDWVDEGLAVPTIGKVRSLVERSLKPIASSTIQRRAMHRFSQRMGERYGMNEQLSQAIFWSVSKRADIAAVSVRGLQRSDFYAAAMDVSMPKSLRNKMTERDVAEDVIWAFEGELGQVGITQKLTGKVKTKLTPIGNAAGVLAEHVYPLVRFKWNPFFQAQEVFETPIILAGRGVWPGGSTKVLNAKTAYVRAKLAGYNESFYRQDQIEFSSLVNASGEAMGSVFGPQSRLGRVLAQTTSVRGIKRAGEQAMFRNEIGRMMVADMRRHSPTQFASIAEWNAVRGLYSTIDDGETAIHMLYDMFSRADPDGALKAVDPTGALGAAKVFGEHGPAMFRPRHIASRPRVETSLVRYIAVGEGWQDMSWRVLRRKLRDPADAEYDLMRLAQDLHKAGADADYIDRVAAMVTFPTAKEFFAELNTMGFPKEQVERMRLWSEELAKSQGQSLTEFLSRTFADAPQVIDRHGNNRGRSLFQRIVSAHEERGFAVVGRDSELLIDIQRVGNSYMPKFTFDPLKPVKDMTTLEVKAREWTGARETRAVTPTIGMPDRLMDAAGQPITFVNGKYISGHFTAKQWREALEATLSEDEIREAADWYVDMRIVVLAQYDNDVDAATRAILGFALTQKNTSPAGGMNHFYAAMEKVRRGEKLPIDKKFDGLGTAELQRLLEDDMVTDAGMAQKLTDFIDSLLGNTTRTAMVKGPDGTWMPAAIDIWAKRDLGFLDSGIKPEYWARITGAQRAVKKPRLLYRELEDGTKVPILIKAGKDKGQQATTDDVHLYFEDGTERVIKGDDLTSEQPDSFQYDYGVERYNEIAEYLNTEKYLTRENWTAADVQAMGWFRAKVAFGDSTGSPLDAFFRNHYNVTFEATPAPGTRYADLYPGLADDGRVPITEAQAASITSDVMEVSVAEAASIAGVQVLTKHATTGTWADASGVANVTPHVTVEILGTDDGLRRFMAAIGELNQQPRVRATKTVAIKTNPTKDNGMRWAIDYPLPTGISKHEANEIHRELISHDDVIAGGSVLVRYDDGTYVVRSVWEPEEGVEYWQRSKFEDEVRIENRASFEWRGRMYDYDEDGYRRGRYVSQEELDGARARGEALVAAMEQEPVLRLDSRGPMGADIEDVPEDFAPDATPLHYEPMGEPGVSYSVDNYNERDVLVIYRDNEGKPVGYVRMDSGNKDVPMRWNDAARRPIVPGAVRGPIHVYVEPDVRRTGVATALYDWVEKQGWDLSESSGKTVTAAGRAFTSARYDRLAPTGLVPLTDELVTDIANRVRAAKWSGASVDLRTGEFLPKGKPRQGPFVTAIGDTKSVAFQNVTEAKFRTALTEFIEENREELSKPGRYLGVFRDEQAGRFDFDINYATWDEDDAEAFQLVFGREGGAYDTYSGNGVYAPVLRDEAKVPARTEPTFIRPVRAKVYYHRIEEADYATEVRGAGRRGAVPNARTDRLVGDGKRRTGEAVERAYGDYAGYETQAFRSERVAAGDERYAAGVDSLPDLGGPAGATSARLFQRAPRGYRAAVRFDTALPDIGTRGGRSTLYFKPGRSARDTLVHEFAHAFSEHLDDSAKRLYLASYNRRYGRAAVGAPQPKNGAKRAQNKNSWDEDVHEQFATDTIEYFRTGQPVQAELQPIFDFYGKYLRASRNRPGLDPKAQQELAQLVGTNQYKGGLAYSAGEQALVDLAFGTSRRAERTTNDTVYFKGERSWAERSVNHPFFGLYPASYMWGKVLPELVEFLTFRPFGLKAPFVALHNVNQVYQSVMTQQENDPELRKWLDDNEEYLRAISMMTPGLPWDIPVNAPLGVRRLVEALEENYYREMTGQEFDTMPELMQRYLGKTIPDIMGYQFGPAMGVESLVETGSGVIGLGSQALGAGFNAVVPKPTEDPGFFPEADSPATPGLGDLRGLRTTPRTLEQAVAQGEQTLVEGLDVDALTEEITQELYATD